MVIVNGGDYCLSRPMILSYSGFFLLPEMVQRGAANPVFEMQSIAVFRGLIKQERPTTTAGS